MVNNLALLELANLLIYRSQGSIFVSGSNPNVDVSGPGYKYPTEYRTERFYPSYYNERRPQPRGLLSQLSYGGPAFDVALDSDDLFGDVQNIAKASVVIIRQGFSTHAMVSWCPHSTSKFTFKCSEHGPTNGRPRINLHRL